MHNIDDFDEFLRSRFIPEPRSNLEQRIIMCAKQSARVDLADGHSLLWRFRAVISDFFEDVLLPAPAFSLAFVLLAGFYIGGNYSLSVTEVTSVSEVSEADVYSYFVIADNLDYGDFSGI